MLGLGMVEHPGDLVGREARIDRVNDGPNTGDRVVELKMAMRVPRNGGDPIAGLHLQRTGQHIGETFRAGVAVFPAIAVNLACIGQAADDLAASVIVGRML